MNNAEQKGSGRSIAIMTLGCKVNQYETQAMADRFRQLGYSIVEADGYADIYIVNTCTVTGLSDRKSRQFIRRAKKINPDAVTAVVGCYAQVSPDEAAAIEGVDIVCGTNEKNNLPDYIDEFLAAGKKINRIKPLEDLVIYEETGVISTMDSRTRAYIKIQEGCDRFCSYCIIPYARGAVRSRQQEAIIREAENLIANGFKELVLTGINTALYGMETGKLRLHELIAAIDTIPGDFRVRLGSLEPTVIDAAYARELLKYKKLCPHMHLSLQSGSDTVLARMDRNYDTAAYEKIVDVLRSHDAGYGVTTDIIVGFPGETDEEFESTKELVKRLLFSKIHVFKYSKRTGTKAAAMANQVPADIKSKRSTELLELAGKTADQYFRSLAGSIRQVLFEEFDRDAGMYSGFSDNYVKIYVQADKSDESGMLLNSFADIRLERTFMDGMAGSFAANKK